MDAFDADGDNLTYSWTFEPGGEKVVGSNAVERTFITSGEKRVAVVVRDGESEISQEWKVTVQEEAASDTTAIALEEPKFKVYVIEQ